MKTNAQVVVIGGGIVGCAVLYHLAKAGWRDIVLIERKELTSGSSWHAAGGLHALVGSANVSRLQKYAQDLYPILEVESGQPVGFHHTGGILLAGSSEEYETLKITQARGMQVGIDAHFISMAEARELSPVLNTDGLHAVMYEPSKGHVDPSSATHAFAQAARKMGAEIYRQCAVTATTQRADGGWDVQTENGTISCQFVVNAAGLWAREVANMAGITLPLMPVEHHYLITESIPEIETMEAGKRLCTMAENEDGFYSRQEGNGILIGAYESKCSHWAVDGTPLDFDTELLPDNLEVMATNFEKAMSRMPCLADAGIKSVINGPMIFSPDLAPLIGPHPDLKNYFCAAGVMTGFNQGAAVGRLLAEWMIDGEPSMDIHSWDVARYGNWANGRYTFERTKLFYENRYNRIYPHQEFEAGRDLRHFAVYDRQKAAGAVFGQNYGWETPLWYARSEDQPQDIYSYRRGNWHSAIAEEARATRDAVGMFECSTFCKYRVTGAEAFDWLNRIMANKLPQKDGKAILTPMLSPKGKVIADFTLTRFGPEEFMLVGAGFMQETHMRWFRQNAADGVKVENISHNYCGIHLAGPNSRELMSSMTNEGVSSQAFPFLTGRKMVLAGVSDCHVFRISFSGELGYEIYMPTADHTAVFDAVLKAGKPLGLRMCGSRTLNALRLEKTFPSWGSDIGPDFTPWEAGLARFVKLDKGFIGRDAAEVSKGAPTSHRVLAAISVEDIDATGGEPIVSGDTYAGYVSSGGYGPTCERALAMCHIKADMMDRTDLQVIMLGERYPLDLLSEAPVDPTGARMRA